MLKNKNIFYYIPFLPTTAGISAYGCDGVDCQGLKCSRAVVSDDSGAFGSVMLILKKIVINRKYFEKKIYLLRFF
jgi:hypothetical protein